MSNGKTSTSYPQFNLIPLLTSGVGWGYNNIMSKKKPKIRDHEIIPVTSISRIERWHMCQRIGKIYYESNVSYEKLLIIKEYLESKGVIA